METNETNEEVINGWYILLESGLELFTEAETSETAIHSVYEQLGDELGKVLCCFDERYIKAIGNGFGQVH